MRGLWNSLGRVKGILTILFASAGFCILGAAFVLMPINQVSMGEEATQTPTLAARPEASTKDLIDESDSPGSDTEDGVIQASFGISTAGNDQIVPDIAYNPDNDNYLIAWQDKRYAPSDLGDIIIHLADASGGLIGGEINLTVSGYLKQTNPQVAYDSAFNQYIVVWQEDVGANDNNVVAQRLDTALNPIGGSVTIQSTSLSDQNPAVAANAIEGGFLIVWEECPKDTEFPSCDIYARYLNSGGGLSSQISIATGTRNQRYPAVAYNSWQNEFLVVWEEFLSISDSDIYGQRMDWNGALIGEPFAIEAPGGLQTKPDIAYNFYNNEYMLVWEDQWGGVSSDWDIKAWRLDGSGGHIDWYMISSNDTKRRMNPSIAYADGAQEYLIAYDYEYGASDIDLWYTRIRSDGLLRLQDGVISNSYDIDENSPAVASNMQEKYFLVWEDSRNYGTTGIDIYGNLTTAYKFYGNVFQNYPGEYTPLEGVNVELYCSGNPDEWGTYLEGSVTDSSGYFSFADHGICSYYNIIEFNPGGFTSTGAQTSGGGSVITTDWIQYLWSLEGKPLGPNVFWDAAPTPTATVTHTPTVTRTPTPTRTNTFTPTATLTNTFTPTNTLIPTPTFTATSSSTFTATPTTANTPTPTNTTQVTPTHTSTSTRTATATNTSTPTATATIEYPITWIHFEEYSGGTYVNDHYAEQGLNFISDYLYGYGFRAAPVIQSSAYARTSPNILVNSATGGEFFSSSNIPLVFWFGQPMAKLGMWLGSVGESCNSVPATINVYDCKGNLISSNPYVASQSFITPLEIDDALGRIQKVVIDFGGSTCPEAIDELAFQPSGIAACTDTSFPSVTIDQPVSGSILTSPGILIQGTIDESGILRSATLNGSRLPVYLNSLTGKYKFNKPVTLQPGSNTYVAAVENFSHQQDSDIAYYMLGAPSSVTLKEFHLTQRGVVKNISCDIDSPFVAAKSTLVRIKLEVKTASGALTHVSSVDLKVYQSIGGGSEILVDTVSGASYPSWGTSFINSSQMDEILFWISPDTFQEAGRYRFEIQPWVGASPFGAPIQLNCGGTYHPFNTTKPLKLLIMPVEAGLSSSILANTSDYQNFLKQIASTSRTFPVADQVYPYFGVRYQEIAPFKMCDGTTNTTSLYPTVCLNTGWEWKFIDKDPSGKVYRAYDTYVDIPSQTFCNANDHMAGGRILGPGLIPYSFDPQLGLFRPGAHPGWARFGGISKHQTPIDEDHDMDIDLEDLSKYLGSHYSENQGKWLYYPSGWYIDGDLFRFFYDENADGCNDTKVDFEAPIIKKFNNMQVILNGPHEVAFNTYNGAIPGTQNDFTSALLVFPYTFVPTDFRFGDVGPGQGDRPGHLVWIRLFPNSSAFAHELGHNVGGLFDQYYDNVADDLLTKENASAVYIGTEKVNPIQAWISMGLDVPWNRVVHYKPDYLALFNKLRTSFISSENGVEEITEVFILSGLREQDDSLDYLHTQRAVDVEQTPANPTSAYKIVFGNGIDTLLEYPFTAGVQAPPPEGYPAIEIYPVPFAVVAPWPAGTSWVEVRKNAEVLARFDQSTSAPWVQLISPNGSEDFSGQNEAVISWVSGDTDPGTTGLVHNIYYSTDGGSNWTLLAAGVGGSQFTWPLSSLPGTSQGLVKVVVSDGFLTGEDTSDGFFIQDNKSPTVVVLSPSDDDEILQCGQIHLDGAVVDPENSIESITWSVDGTPVANDLQTLIPPLSPGLHTITLEVTDSSDQTGSDSLEIEILADLDCDGMADTWEMLHGFDPTDPTDAGQDADGDGVPNRDEYWWGIDPNDPDTDEDGISDGTEIAQGTNPAVPEPGPTEYWLYLPSIRR